MMRLLIFAVCLVFCHRTFAQSVLLHGRSLPVPGGDIIGAAFDDEDNSVIIQQVVVSTSVDALQNYSHRRLLVWSVADNSWGLSRELPVNGASGLVHPCGRVEALSVVRQSLLCSAQSYLEVVDSSSLAPVRQIGSSQIQNIYDFAVDERRNRVYVVSLRSDQSVHLALYSLNDGTVREDLPVSAVAWGGVMLALDTGSGNVVISELHQAGHSNQGNLYYCGPAPTLHCQNAVKVSPVSQMSFQGVRLLFVTSGLATDKKDCIQSLVLTTGSVSKAYCSPGTGVHYAVGVVNKRYVAAFTGTSNIHAFLESVSSKESSFSVWNADRRTVAAKTLDPNDYGSSQYEIRVVASGIKPEFVGFARGTNKIRLYTVVAPE